MKWYKGKDEELNTATEIPLKVTQLKGNGNTSEICARIVKIGVKS